LLNINNLNPTSDKKFGYFFSAIFALASLYFLLHRFNSFVWLVLILITCLSLLVASYKPDLFSKLNTIWFLLALVLGRIFNPIVLGVIYFLVLTPIGLITRLFGRDELLLKRADQKTYWLLKDETLKSRQSYKDQF
jgi:RsiW-degrading membrane proteinase PrsW (M82 family)